MSEITELEKAIEKQKLLLYYYSKQLEQIKKDRSQLRRGDFYHVINENNHFYVKRLKSAFGNRDTVSYEFETELKAIEFMAALEAEIFAYFVQNDE